MQFFYIKQGSTLPTLRMELIEDGRHDFHKFHECIQSADITFTMVNIDTNVTKVAKGKAYIKLRENDDCTEQYAMIGRHMTQRKLAHMREHLKSISMEISRMMNIPIQVDCLICLLGNPC